MSEESEIKRIGAVSVRNSGRGLKKGDAVFNQFLVDIKEYTGSFSVSRSVWAKLTKDCMTHKNLQPALLLSLLSKNNSPIRLWVISDAAFKEMHEAWMEKHGLET